MSEATDNPLRDLPAVSDVLAAAEGEALVAAYGAGMVKLELRHLLDGVRACLRHGRLQACPDLPALCAELTQRLARLTTPAGRQAINATGILLHTGLGRAPLCDGALAALQAAARYTILQTSLDTGKRNLREEKIERLLRALTGCEAATVVNNNAAATMLLLNTLAQGREVVISRGQLIEIGGAYRMMDVMTMSGCTLREVGCTNRTHLRDYEAAIHEATGALIHVHTSNYRIRGFSSSPGIRELAALGKERGLPVIDDLGSGALVPLAEWGLPDEPLVPESVRAGASVACFSGDKLICGPQAGIIVGREDVIQQVRKNPFARMFRVDKLTLAALEATLIHFINGTYRELPFYQMLSRAPETLETQAEAVAEALRSVVEVDIVDDMAYVGSGSLPDQGVPSKVVRLKNTRTGVEDLARRLRLATPSVFGRVQDEALLLDMRTVGTHEVDALVTAVTRALLPA